MGNLSDDPWSKGIKHPRLPDDFIRSEREVPKATHFNQPRFFLVDLGSCLAH